MVKAHSKINIERSCLAEECNTKWNIENDTENCFGKSVTVNLHVCKIAENAYFKFRTRFYLLLLPSNAVRGKCNAIAEFCHKIPKSTHALRLQVFFRTNLAAMLLLCDNLKASLPFSSHHFLVAYWSFHLRYAKMHARYSHLCQF